MSRTILRVLESLRGVHTHRAAPAALPDPKSAPPRNAKIVHADGWAMPFLLPDDTPRIQLVDDETMRQWSYAHDLGRVQTTTAHVEAEP